MFYQIYLENGAELFFASEYYDSPLFPILTNVTLLHLCNFDLSKCSFRFEGRTNTYFFSKTFLNKLRGWSGFLSYYNFFSVSGEVKERKIYKLNIFGKPIRDGLDELAFNIKWGVHSQGICEVNFFISRWPHYVCSVSLPNVQCNQLKGLVLVSVPRNHDEIFITSPSLRELRLASFCDCHWIEAISQKYSGQPKVLKIVNCHKLEQILIGRFSLIDVTSIEIESR